MKNLDLKGDQMNLIDDPYTVPKLHNSWVCYYLSHDANKVVTPSIAHMASRNYTIREPDIFIERYRRKATFCKSTSKEDHGFGRFFE